MFTLCSFVLSQPSGLFYTICFDSKYAAHVVQQSWQANSHMEVVRFAGELHRRCDLHAEVCWHWVRGHSRDLGSDAADSLAKAGAREQRGLWQDCALVSLLHASAVGCAIPEPLWSIVCKSLHFSQQLVRRLRAGKSLACHRIAGPISDCSRTCIFPLESCFLWCSVSLLARWQDISVHPLRRFC